MAPQATEDAMETTNLMISAKSYPAAELAPDDRGLLDAALAAAGRAYAPYSGYRVGVALRLADGRIVDGNNQENAAYPSGICAERTALFAAQAQNPDVPVSALALTATFDGDIVLHPSPCGACRQVIMETETRFRHPIRILLCGKNDVLEVSSAHALLPFWTSPEV